MEYANTFSLDFPVELWRPFAQDRPSVRCSSGYLIYLQGTEATCFYYLKKGKVKSFIQSETGGELFAKASISSKSERSDSASKKTLSRSLSAAGPSAENENTKIFAPDGESV